MKCQWFTCEDEAVIRVPRASTNLCKEHYLLNCVRFGCDLKGELLEESEARLNDVNGLLNKTPEVGALEQMDEPHSGDAIDFAPPEDVT